MLTLKHCDVLSSLGQELTSAGLLCHHLTLVMFHVCPFVT